MKDDEWEGRDRELLEAKGLERTVLALRRQILTDAATCTRERLGALEQEIAHHLARIAELAPQLARRLAGEAVRPPRGLRGTGCRKR